jgi:hypothetical protein
LMDGIFQADCIVIAGNFGCNGTCLRNRQYLVATGWAITWQVDVCTLQLCFWRNYKNGIFSLKFLLVAWEFQMFGYWITGIYCSLFCISDICQFNNLY